jgi:putative holliday junction resolvase
VIVRALGLDLGSRRIGVAVSDRSGTVASALCVVTRTGDRARDHRTLAELVREEEVEIVVVGLPLALSGREGTAARAARNEAGHLASVIDVPVVLHDERLTTVTATRALREAGVSSRRSRNIVDKVAAAVLLQAWLDSRGVDEVP